MDYLGIIGGIAGILSIVLFIWKFGFQWSRICDEICFLKDNFSKLENKVESLENIVNKIETKIEPFWNIIKENLPAIIQYTKSEDLIKKLAQDEITLEELEILENKIKENIRNSPKPSKDLLPEIISLWMISTKKLESSRRNKNV